MTAGQVAAAGRAKAPVARRLAEHGISAGLLMLAPALALYFALFVYPMLYGLQLSLTGAQGGLSLENYQRFFSDPFFSRTIWFTTRLAIPGVLINLAMALPLAIRMRRQARGRRWLSAVLVFPLTLGSVLMAKGLITFLSGAGWVNRALLALGVVDTPVQLVHNYWGVLIAIVMADFPFVFLILLSYASGIDPTYERAAAVFGAGARERFRLIVLPLLAPGLTVTASLAFVLAFGVFPSALLVGEPSGSTRTMGVAAYRAAFQQFDYPMGATVALLMASIELVVIAVVLTLQARFAPAVQSGRRG